LVFIGNGFFKGSNLRNKIMVKRISIILLVSAILITGYISFRKLNYWERSVMIFKYDFSAQSFGGRGGRGFREFEGFPGENRRPELREGTERPGVTGIPDSLRRRIDGRGQRNFNRIRPGSDSLSVSRIGRDQGFTGRGNIAGNFRGRDGNTGRDFRRGKAVNLNMVIYYLGVFALFTVIMVYIEKGYNLLIKKKKLSQEESDLII
jgi:hypothetical protein